MQLRVLGRFDVQMDGKVLPSKTWRRRRAVDLLTALAIAPGHHLPKAEVIHGFWPSKDAARGANNLHRALHDLRKALQHRAIAIEGDTLRLDPDVWIDVDAFEDGCDRGEPDAIALYQGPPDLDFEPLESRIEALRQRFVDASLTVARRDLATAPERALSVLRHLLEHAPTIEEGHRLAMRILADSGRVVEALAQFDACVEALAEGPGLAPSAAAAGLANRLRSEQRGRRAPRPDGPARVARTLLGTKAPRPQRGRTEAIATVDRFVEHGDGLLLLVGPPGIGKTRLAVEAAQRAHDRGAVLLAGAGLEFDGMPPFAPFIEAFRAWDRAAGGGDNPFLAFRPSGAVNDDALRLYQSVDQALVAIGGGRPVGLVIDDLHHADASSLHLLHYLARCARPSRLVLLGTARSDGLRPGTELHTVLASMHRERSVTRLDLAPLDMASSEALLRDLAPEVDLPESLLHRFHTLADGNPFYLEELVAAYQEHGRIEVPEQLQATVLDRVRRLGDDAGALLRAASVIGRHFDFELATRVAQLPLARALEALEVCLGADLVRDDGDRYRFRHALVQEAVQQSMPRARRRVVHRAVAAHIETGGGYTPTDRVERLARHHRLAGDVDRAVPYLLEAARRAFRNTGLAEAIAFYHQADNLLERR